MAGIFKIKYAPNGVALTDANTYFVCSTIGTSDNPGTRNAPLASISAAVLKGNKSYIVANGYFKEDFSWTGVLIADGYLRIDGNIYASNGSYFYGFSAASINVVQYACNIVNCNIDFFRNNGATTGGIYSGNKIGVFHSIQNGNLEANIVTKNNTILKLVNASISSNNNLYNHIIISELELYNINGLYSKNILTFHNFIILKSVSFKWNGATIPIAYGAEPANYLNDLLASLTAFANTLQNVTEKAYLQAIIAGTFESTCQIVDDSTQRIFNRYYNNVPIDFTLKTSNNPALTASSVGGYVGAYKGGVQLPPPEIKDINPATLAETANVPDFIVKKPSGAITAVLGASQKLNAVKFTDVVVPKETMLSGSVSDFKSGLGSSIMTVGIIQPLSINTLPQEGFAVVPKDAPGVVSQTLPKLTMKFNGETELFYKALTGLPLTFNDLAGLGIATDKNLALYGTWGVTTADYEGYLLAGLNTVVAKKIKLKYCDIVIYIYNAAE